MSLFPAGGVLNQTGYPINCQWFGLPSSTLWTLAGGADWLGTAYAPEATLKLTGNVDYYGGFVAGSLVQGGQSAVHYDEALARAGGGMLFRVVSWQPLVNRNGAWVMETN